MIFEILSPSNANCAWDDLEPVRPDTVKGVWIRRRTFYTQKVAGSLLTMIVQIRTSLIVKVPLKTYFEYDFSRTCLFRLLLQVLHTTRETVNRTNK